jgi:Isochorismatase family
MSSIIFSATSRHQLLRALTGLLIVDLCNDLLSEDGELCRSTLDASNVVEHLRQVLDAARSNGILVFITPHHHWRKVVDVDVTPPRTSGSGSGEGLEPPTPGL